MGPRVNNPFNDIWSWLTIHTPDDQIRDVLNNPRMRENDKVADLQKIFSNLSEDEKQYLYDRLHPKDKNDPVSRDFHYRLSHGHKPGQLSSVDRALKALNPNHKTESGTDTNVKESGRKSGRDSSQVTEKKAEGIVRQAELEKQMKQNVEYEKGVKEVIQVAYDEKNAKVAVKELLETASIDQLKQVISGSEKWHSDNRKIVNEVIAESPNIMKKVATHFSAEEQHKILDRVVGMEISSDPAEKSKQTNLRSQSLREWISNTPKDVLNKAIDKKEHAEIIGNEILNQIKYEDFGGFDKLNSRYKGGLLNMLARDSEVSSDSVSALFKRMTPTEKNDVIDLYQKDHPDTLPDFLSTIASQIDPKFMEGISEENARFMRETFATLAEDPSASDKALYQKMANYLKGWIEETFKK